MNIDFNHIHYSKAEFILDTSGGYCIKRYQTKNSVIPACDCINHKCSGRTNENFADTPVEKGPATE